MRGIFTIASGIFEALLAACRGQEAVEHPSIASRLLFRVEGHAVGAVGVV